jgi:hypothetical protein
MANSARRAVGRASRRASGRRKGAPRKTRDVKGGFALSVQKKNDDTVAGQIQKIG